MGKLQGLMEDLARIEKLLATSAPGSNRTEGEIQTFNARIGAIVRKHGMAIFTEAGTPTTPKTKVAPITTTPPVTTHTIEGQWVGLYPVYVMAKRPTAVLLRTWPVEGVAQDLWLPLASLSQSDLPKLEKGKIIRIHVGYGMAVRKGLIRGEPAYAD